MAEDVYCEDRAENLQEVPAPVILARLAVEAFVLRHERISPPAELAARLPGRAGVFVCLKKLGELRGCIGTIQPTEPNLAEEIISSAISAATCDPRFPPVKGHELPNLTYTVDILTEPEPVASAAELDPKRYGVIVQCGKRRGLLLPDLEGVDTVQRQIEICRQKAGIGAREPVNLFRFKVIRYA